MDLGGEEESRGSRRSSRLEWSGVEENPPPRRTTGSKHSRGIQ